MSKKVNKTTCLKKDLGFGRRFGNLVYIGNPFHSDERTD